MQTKLFTILLSLLLLGNILHAQDIVFSPHWTAQSQFAGYYVALEKGFYKDAGLNVTIKHSSQSNNSISMVKENRTNIITLQLIDALLANQDGVDLVNLMQVSQNNALTIVMQPQYTSIQDLHGKRLAGWQSGFCTPAICFGEDNKLQFNWVHIMSGINTFTSNAVDAILAMSYNELFVLLHCGKRITEENIIYFSDYEGYNVPEDGVYCKRSFFEENPDVCKKFAEASRQGWEYADTHREEALEIVVSTMKNEGIPVNRPHQAYELEKILEQRLDKDTKLPTYKLTPEAFVLADEMLLFHNYISRSSDYYEFAPLTSKKGE